MKHSLDNTKMLYVAKRDEWRDWLKRHYKSEKEVWLVYFKKHTGKSRISYTEAVEEALCFAWIDSTVKRIDDDSFAQRFSPRNLKTPYSQANKERLRELVKQGKIAKDVLATLPDLAEEEFEVPPDILKAIKRNKEARKNLQSFSPRYIRIRVAFIDGARNRPEEFKKRPRYFIQMTERNKQFGFGGIEKYY